MKKYNGTKTVMAEPMTKSEAEKVLKRSLADAKGGEDGYFIKYPDGYKSWSPKETFEKAYKLVEHENKCCDPDFLVRMRDEYNELCDRYFKLTRKLYNISFNEKLDKEQRELLERQWYVMHEYINVLGKRITTEYKKTQEEMLRQLSNEKYNLVGKIVVGTGFECATCKFDELDEDCLKLDVPGIGTLCLGDNPMQWRDIKDTKLETRAYFVHQYWPNNKRFVFVAEYNAEKDEWRPWNDIEVAGMPLDNSQREQITHVMPVLYPVLIVPQNKMEPINFTDDE